MHRNTNSFFGQLPNELKQMILRKISFNELAVRRCVSKEWCELIDGLLFDEELRGQPDSKQVFYVPVFEPMQPHIRSWHYALDDKIPRYFFRSSKLLFETIKKANGCYKVLLSLNEIKQKEKKLQIELSPLRYFMHYGISASAVCSYLKKQSGEELNNPFYAASAIGPSLDKKIT